MKAWERFAFDAADASEAAHVLPAPMAAVLEERDATRDLLGPGLTREPRGTIEVKGKGPMRTWFVSRAPGSEHAPAP